MGVGVGGTLVCLLLLLFDGGQAALLLHGFHPVALHHVQPLRPQPTLQTQEFSFFTMSSRARTFAVHDPFWHQKITSTTCHHHAGRIYVCDLAQASRHVT